METHRAAFRKVMVPVDLAHAERLEKAIAAGTDLARHYGIPLCFVGVTAETPSDVARSPREDADRLGAFRLPDHHFISTAGAITLHAEMSVFVVR